MHVFDGTHHDFNDALIRAEFDQAMGFDRAGRLDFSNSNVARVNIDGAATTPPEMPSLGALEQALEFHFPGADPQPLSSSGQLSLPQSAARLSPPHTGDDLWAQWSSEGERSINRGAGLPLPGVQYRRSQHHEAQENRDQQETLAAALFRAPQSRSQEAADALALHVSTWISCAGGVAPPKGHRSQKRDQDWESS